MCAGNNILFKLSGSIAAWKACAIISQLVKDGHTVQTVATEAALRFVGAATLEGLTGRPVRANMWERGTAMEHINLVKWADVTVLCPATANTINRLANGLADDLVGSLFLAHDRAKPYLVAPAMNPAMWAHPATAAGVDKIRSWGARVLPVASGRLACGDEGEGRLIEPEAILAAIRAALPDARGQQPPTSARLRVLVTSGGTEEPIDGVRAIGNFSTGRTGAVIADSLAAQGHEVTLLKATRAQAGALVQDTEEYCTFPELEGALKDLLKRNRFDAVIHAAAVSDYTVSSLTVDGKEQAPDNRKLGSGHSVSIQLRPTEKLIDQLRSWSANPGVRVVAFKLTRGSSDAEAGAAVETLFSHSNADAIVHNDLEALGAEHNQFPSTLWSRTGEAVSLDTRDALARELNRFLLTSTTSTPAASATSQT